MLFQSAIFLFAFLPVVLCTAVWLARRFGNEATVWFLIVASLVFYGYHNWTYVPLVLGSVIVNYHLARALRGKRTGLVLAVGISFNLLLLAYFKYAHFLTVSFGLASPEASPFRGIVLPIAISFFTFQQIAFLVDVRRDPKIKYDFSRYVLFVIVFPHLIAGPIVHHSELTRQFNDLARRMAFWQRNLVIGAIIFSLGLAKKLLIADSAGAYADLVFDAAAAGRRPDLVETWVGTLAYTLQIYFDFSGYSDMAVGLARMFGILLPINFFSPYRSTSIVEFWRRWHITLSRFLRQYLYIPLGGNRRGPVRRYASLIAVMLLGGLWHGANWTFVVWGGLHAFYLCVNHAWRGAGWRLGPVGCDRAIGWTLTFLAVALAWIPFRATDLATATVLLKGAVGANGIVLPRPFESTLGGFSLFTFSNDPYRRFLDIAGFLTLLWLPVGFALAIASPNLYQTLRAFRPALDSHRYTTSEAVPGARGRVLRLGPGLAVTAAAIALFWVAVASQSSTNEFLYFQF